MTKAQAHRLSREIAAELFSDKFGDKAEALKLISHRGVDLGSWGICAVRACIFQQLAPMITKRTKPPKVRP